MPTFSGKEWRPVLPILLLALIFPGGSCRVLTHLTTGIEGASETPLSSNDSTASIESVADLPPPKCFVVNESSDTCITVDASAVGLGFENETSIQASPTCGLSTVIPPEKLGTCPDAQDALNAHNAARARYGAAPLLWSRTLANYALGVSDTCNFAHSNGPYGENLAIGPGLTCTSALNLWMAEEKQWNPQNPGFSDATGHFTAAVWKATTQVGCASFSCSNRNFITCSYNPPGNVIGSFNTQVGRSGEAPDCVASPVQPPAVPPPVVPPPVVQPPVVPPPVPVVPPPTGPTPPPRRCCIFGIICFAC